MKVLVILAHPNMDKSIFNKKWIEKLEKYSDNITINDLYKKYKDWNINIEKEQQLLLSHDKIVFQFPFYWYSAPPLLKHWFDEVISHNWAYDNNYALENKKIGVATTIGGFEEEYTKNGAVKHTLEELLLPIYSSISYIKAIPIKPFAIYGTGYKLEDKFIEENCNKYLEYLLEI